MRCALVIPRATPAPPGPAAAGPGRFKRRQPDSILVVDSRSSDDTLEHFPRAFGRAGHIIEPASFNHGGTRPFGQPAGRGRRADLPDPGRHSASPDKFRQPARRTLCRADIEVTTARQLPHPGAWPARRPGAALQPPAGKPRSKRPARRLAELGIKTCFSSDSFSALPQRRPGGSRRLPRKTSSAARNAKVAARACCRPAYGCATRPAPRSTISHDYRLLEEFRRYFDIGVFYGRERWIRCAFGGAGGGASAMSSPRYRLRAAGALYRVPEIALRSAFQAARLPPWPVGTPPAGRPQAPHQHVSRLLE